MNLLKKSRGIATRVKEKANMMLVKTLNKNSGDEKVIVTIGLMVVGVFFLVKYKEQVTPIITDLIAKVGDSIKNMFSAVVS